MPRLYSDSLHDYRLHFPGSAPTPTVTQSGWVALILERQRKKALRIAARRAARHRLVATVSRLVRWLMQAPAAMRAHWHPGHVTAHRAA